MERVKVQWRNRTINELNRDIAERIAAKGQCEILTTPVVQEAAPALAKTARAKLEKRAVKLGLGSDEEIKSLADGALVELLAGEK